MPKEISVRLREQYQKIVEAIETQGLDYALTFGGYILPNTDDEELNEAIIKAKESLEKIEDIIGPYKI